MARELPLPAKIVSTVFFGFVSIWAVCQLLGDDGTFAWLFAGMLFLSETMIVVVWFYRRDRSNALFIIITALVAAGGPAFEQAGHHIAAVLATAGVGAVVIAQVMFGPTISRLFETIDEWVARRFSGRRARATTAVSTPPVTPPAPPAPPAPPTPPLKPARRHRQALAGALACAAIVGGAALLLRARGASVEPSSRLRRRPRRR